MKKNYNIYLAKEDTAMKYLCDEQKRLNIAEALEIFDQLPDDLKDIALAHMQEILKENRQE